jgi:two-component system, NtrC family, nitrogen regulation response regulator NtrX
LRDEGGDPQGGAGGDTTLVQARLAFERQYILRALERSRWNQSIAARALGIHRNTLLQKMKALNLGEGDTDYT